MSRNNIFLILAGAILASMLSGNQPGSTHASRMTIASLISVPDEGMSAAVPSMLQHSFDNQ